MFLSRFPHPIGEVSSRGRKTIPLDEFKPKLGIDPFYPLRIGIANRPGAGRSLVVGARPMVADGIEFGNGFFLDSDLNFSFNVAHLLNLKNKQKFSMQCYRGEEKNDSPWFTFKRDKNRFEYEKFGVGSGKFVYTASPDKFSYQNEDTKYEVSLASNKLISSFSSWPLPLEIKQEGKNFVSNNKNEIGSVIDHTEEGEPVLKNLEVSSYNHKDVLTFTKKDGKSVIRWNFSASMHGDFEYILNFFKTKNSALLYDRNGRGFIVKIQGNRVFVDGALYERFSYFNCEWN
ncbi:hypothetical protein CH379_009450 [Leptospira ellisii]|uniref:Uncharacterized protein n=1 Tax=Leptospira ellisii TaxID=2023197 RepID=A0AAE4TXX4_9LEPT|nr:hypothetical protein [Leptospira ellisii]MDV6235849.1 hypothetical protein [Leptospira ellisii]